MIYELQDTKKVQELFRGWQATLILSCLQQVMGKIYVTDVSEPRAAFAFVGCFGFYAGEPERELVEQKPEGFAILTPQNSAWAALIEDCFPDARKVTRYAIKKDTRFEPAALQRERDRLPEGYVLKEIDGVLYEKCLTESFSRDFVSSFLNKEQFLSLGRGVVILKNGRIVSGASSYSRYREGIELEVDTVEEERRKHLATAACAALILRCLKEGLYPSWDAQNRISVRLAEKLGYEFSHEYTAYEVDV